MVWLHPYTLCQIHLGWFLSQASADQTKQNGLGKLRRLCAPATTKIHNNTNTIAPLTRGFLHLPRRTIAANVAAFEICLKDNKQNEEHEMVCLQAC